MFVCAADAVDDLVGGLLIYLGAVRGEGVHVLFKGVFCTAEPALGDVVSTSSESSSFVAP